MDGWGVGGSNQWRSDQSDVIEMQSRDELMHSLSWRLSEHSHVEKKTFSFFGVHEKNVYWRKSLNYVLKDHE